MNSKPSRNLRRNSTNANTLAIVVAFAGALFAMAALSVDVGNVIVQRGYIQEAGDSAALAAIKDWAIGTANETVQLVGKDFAVSNGARTNELVSVTVGKWDNSSKTFSAKDPLASGDVPAVEVKLQRAVNLAFAPVVGIRRMNPRTTSIAIAGRANGVIGVVPWAICTNGIPALPTKCDTVEIKNGGDCSGTGNFGAIALGDNGADTYRENIAEGYEGMVHVGDIVATEPGNMSGPTTQGLKDRLAGAPPYVCTETSAPPSNGRLAIVPVTGDLGGGKSPVQILGFWVFALDDPQGGKVTGRFVEAFNGLDVDPNLPPVLGLLNGVALVK